VSHVVTRRLGLPRNTLKVKIQKDNIAVRD